MKNLNNETAKVAAKVISNFNEAWKSEQGDVPGWVLVTVMTAGLVVALWSIADGQLKSVLQNAIHSVSTP